MILARLLRCGGGRGVWLEAVVVVHAHTTSTQPNPPDRRAEAVRDDGSLRRPRAGLFFATVPACMHARYMGSCLFAHVVLLACYCSSASIAAPRSVFYVVVAAARLVWDGGGVAPGEHGNGSVQGRDTRFVRENRVSDTT